MKEETSPELKFIECEEQSINRQVIIIIGYVIVYICDIFLNL